MAAVVEGDSRARMHYALSAYVVFLVTATLVDWISSYHHDSQAMLVMLLVPYVVILAVALSIWQIGALQFPIGSPARPLSRASALWLMGLVVALLVSPVSHLLIVGPSLAYALCVSIIIIGPLAEEFLFRGVIQTSLNRSRLGNFCIGELKLGTLTTATAFAFAHIINWVFYPRLFHLWQVLFVFALGLFTGLVYDKTSNIWYGAYIHALYNVAMFP